MRNLPSSFGFQVHMQKWKCFHFENSEVLVFLLPLSNFSGKCLQEIYLFGWRYLLISTEIFLTFSPWQSYLLAFITCLASTGIMRWQKKIISFFLAIYISYACLWIAHLFHLRVLLTWLVKQFNCAAHLIHLKPPLSLQEHFTISDTWIWTPRILSNGPTIWEILGVEEYNIWKNIERKLKKYSLNISLLYSHIENLERL